MINLKESLLEVQSGFEKIPGSKLLLKTLKTQFRENEINNFILKNQNLRGFTFLDKVLERFNFTYQATAKFYSNIPAEDRVIIVANLSINSLGGLSILKLVRLNRHDIHHVANVLLSNVKPLKSLFLSVEVLSKKTPYKSLYGFNRINKQRTYEYHREENSLNLT